MRIYKHFVVLIGLSAAATAASPEPNIFSQFDPLPEESGVYATEIPKKFHGEWNSDISSCFADDSEGQLLIKAQAMIFPKTDAEVKRVIIHNARTVSIKASFTTDGESWDSYERMILSRSGETLTIGKGRLKFVRSRCPTNKEMTNAEN